jgi:hypothetical protein
MASKAVRIRSWVRVHVPTKDRNNKFLPKPAVDACKKRVEQLFKQHLDGYYKAPYYRIPGRGAYKSKGGEWIEEPVTLICGYGSAHAIRELVRALKEGLLVEMGQALKQESVAVESSVFGFELLFLDEGEKGGKDVEGRSKTERHKG